MSTSNRLGGERLRQLSRVSDARAALDLARVWGTIAAAALAAHACGRGWAFLLAALVISACQSALANLAHDAWHRLCFRSRRLNDAVGAWLYAAPVGVPFFHDRRRHLLHHRTMGRPEDPDWVNYTNEGRETPVRLLAQLGLRLCGGLLIDTAWSSLARRRPRIAVAAPAGPGEPSARRELLRVAAVQLLLCGSMGAAFGWWSYPLLWLLPLATLTAFCNGLRAFVEHAMPGDEGAPELRVRDIEPGLLERAFVSPAHFHHHALHHAHPSIPHHALPAAKRELIRTHGRYPHPVAPGYLGLLRQHLHALARAGADSAA